MRNITPLVAPRSIAVIGASANPTKSGGVLFDNLLKGNFQGALYPINRTAKEIMGKTAYPTLAEVPEMQRASGPDRHGRAPGLVRALPQRMGVRIPVVEIPYHGDGSARLVDRQCERDTDGTVTAGPGCLDH